MVSFDKTIESLGIVRAIVVYMQAVEVIVSVIINHNLLIIMTKCRIFKPFWRMVAVCFCRFVLLRGIGIAFVGYKANILLDGVLNSRWWLHRN